MTNRYDAIVIGAGNSGLASSIALSQAGKKTLLVEKQIIADYVTIGKD